MPPSHLPIPTRHLVSSLVIVTLLASCTTDDDPGAASTPPGSTDPPTESPLPAPATPSEGGVVVPAGGVLAPSSLWRQDVTDRNVAADSTSKVGAMTEALAGLYGGVAAFSVYQYGLAWYTVEPQVTPTDVAFEDCQNKGFLPPGLLGPSGQFEDVPIPPGATPTPGTDSSLTIYQPETDTLWSFWKAYRDSTGWRACWGGRIDDFSRSDGAFDFPFGASASGLAREAGTVSINDVRSGAIKHAVALSLPASVLAQGFVPPATRSDGASTEPTAIAEGSRLRLDPELDLSALDLSRVARLVAEAAQTYGFIVVDKSTTITIPAEAPYAEQERSGADPWEPLLGGDQPYQVLENFPWGRLQVLELPGG